MATQGLVTITVTCGCVRPSGEPHQFAVVWKNGHPGGPLSFETLPLTGHHIKAFTQREVPSVLDELASWCRRGGKIKNIEIAAIPGY